MEYTDEEKRTHYQILIDTIQFLSNNGRVTEDWMEEHKKLIMKYRRAYMEDMKYVNSEIQDSEFREAAREAEALLSKMVNTIIKQGTFNLQTYLLFCKKINFMVDFVSTYYPESEIESLLSEMKI